MVVALGPGKFYGSSLPRPRFFDKEDRVDPPTPVLDPFLSWANEAHWSMGGLSFKRLRLQGKIEGNIEKLRKEQEKKDHTPGPESKVKSSKGKKWVDSDDSDDDGEEEDSAPPAPISKKTRGRWAALVDEEEDESSGDESEEEVVMKKRRRLVRKLGDDFEMVADDNVETISGRVARRTRSRRSVVMVENDDESEGRKASVSLKKASKKTGVKSSDSTSNGGSGSSSRSSPRLKKKSS